MVKSQNCVILIHKNIVYIKADDIYKYIAAYVETSVLASNYALEKPLPKGENKKVI